MIYLEGFQRYFLDTLGGKNAKEYERFMLAFARAMRIQIMQEAKENMPAWFGRAFSKEYTPLNIAYSKRRRALFIWGLPPNKNVGKHYQLKERETAKTAFFSPERLVIGSSVSKGEPFFMVRKKKRMGAPPGFFLSKSSHAEIHPAADGRFYASSGGRRYPFPPMWYIEDGRVRFARDESSVSDKIVKMFDTFAPVAFSNAMSKFLKKEFKK